MEVVDKTVARSNPDCGDRSASIRMACTSNTYGLGMSVKSLSVTERLFHITIIWFAGFRGLFLVACGAVKFFSSPRQKETSFLLSAGISLGHCHLTTYCLNSYTVYVEAVGILVFSV